MDEIHQFCGYCGKPMDQADLFCGSCGQPVDPPVGNEQLSQPPPAPGPVQQPLISPATPPLPVPPGPESPGPRRRRTSAATVTWLVVALILAGVAIAAWRCSRITELVPMPASGVLSLARPDINEVTALAFSIDMDIMADPYYNLLACGSAGGSIHVYDNRGFELVETFEQVTTGGQPVTALTVGSDWRYDETVDDFTYSGEYIVWSSAGGAGVIIWDPRLAPGERQLSRSIVADSAGPGLRLDPGYDNYLQRIWVFNVADQAVHGWDCASAALIDSADWPAELPPVSRLARSINGHYAALELDSSCITICDSWEATGGLTDYGLQVCRYDAGYPPAPAAYAVGSTGLLALTGGGAGRRQVLVYDFMESQQLWNLPVSADMSSLAFSYHGDRLAGGGPGFVRLWDVYTGEVITELAMP